VDKKLATDLLLNLLDRASESTSRVFLTRREIEALASLVDADGKATALHQKDVRQGGQASNIQLKKIAIDKRKIPSNILTCIDFGTAFSKAFATKDNKTDQPELIDLPIGDGSTGSTLTTPSELMIDEGRIYFGQHARKRLDDIEASPARLIDSIKQFITLNSDVTLLEKIKLDPDQDPTQSFSRRDILVLYLAHLMHLMETALVREELPINVRRRFAHPAWKDKSKEKNEVEMRKMMAQAIVIARSVGDSLATGMSTNDARALLEQVNSLQNEFLPLALIHDPVREATAAGAGALLATEENRREAYLIVDIGAGTTDVAGFICVNNPDWHKSRLFEITGAADAKNMAGNVLDTALQKFILDKSALVQDSEEYRAAAMAVRRDRRVLKEQLFRNGEVIVPLPTDENVKVTLDEFQAYPQVLTFSEQIRQMVAKSAAVVAGDSSQINLVATGGGASLPLVKALAAEGVDFEGRHIAFTLREPLAPGIRETNPDLVDLYPQIAVALGGALPTLPEQRSAVPEGLVSTPKRYIGPMYKS
jgi:molecular chaperone DnaK